MIKKYEQYKDSEVEWIEKIPQEWMISQYKFESTVQNGFAFKSELFDKNEGFPILRIRDITNGEISTYYKGDFSDNYVIRKGDLLVGMDGDYNIRWWNNGDALLNQRCCRIKEKESVSRRFLYYSLPFNLKIINDLTYFTTVKHLSSGDILNAKFPRPSYSEQTKIAEYLDHQTELIDAIIKKKQQIINRLKEQRQAIISEAVTKGLDPNAPMKDSGVEWMGNISEHWELVKLKYLNKKIGSGVTPRGGGEVYVDEGALFLRSQNVHFEGLSLKDVKRIDEETHNRMNNSKVKQNDVLLNITGASIGRCCVVKLDEEININQHVCIIRPNKRIISNYLNLVLQSRVGQTQVELLATGGNREGLTFEAIKNFTIPLPTTNEQLEVTSTILQKTADLERVLKQSKEQIELLKKYRQSVISEAVTGKIDVREWEPKVREIE